MRPAAASVSGSIGIHSSLLLPSDGSGGCRRWCRRRLAGFDDGALRRRRLRRRELMDAVHQRVEPAVVVGVARLPRRGWNRLTCDSTSIAPIVRKAIGGICLNKPTLPPKWSKLAAGFASGWIGCADCAGGDERTRCSVRAVVVGYARSTELQQTAIRQPSHAQIRYASDSLALAP